MKCAFPVLKPKQDMLHAVLFSRVRDHYRPVVRMRVRDSSPRLLQKVGQDLQGLQRLGMRTAQNFLSSLPKTSTPS